jgi:uncharacterized membrane protein YdjX (TVP38/TMEM64 family)
VRFTKVTRYWKWAVTALLVAAVFLVSRVAPLDRWLESLVAALEGKGALGMALFTFVYVIAMVACVWGTPFTLAAGMAFGVGWGTLVATVGATGGSAVAFLIARYLARDTIQRWASRNPKYLAIESAMGKHGWKMVFLTRFSPVVPFSISNYLFGLTSVGFWPFVWASLAAILPGSFVVAYLGHIGRMTLLRGADAWGTMEYVLMAGGVVFTAGIVLYFTHLARKELALVRARKAGEDEGRQHP